MQLMLSIRTFACAARVGSVSAAARAGNISVARASRLITNLERHLGAQLLNRSPNGLNLTQAGEKLLHSVCPLVDELETALESVGTLDSETKGLLRVHLRTIIAHEILVPALPRLLAQNPNLQLELIVSNKESIDIASSNIDVDITFKEPDSLDLVAMKLKNKSMDMTLVSSPDYITKKGSISSPKEIKNYDCITYSNDNGRVSWAYKDTCGETKFIDIDPKLITNNGSTMRNAALEGCGICILPQWVVEKDLRQGTLVEILPEFRFHYPQFSNDIFAVYQKSKRRSAKLKVFLRFVKEIFAENGNPDFR